MENYQFSEPIRNFRSKEKRCTGYNAPISSMSIHATPLGDYQAMKIARIEHGDRPDHAATAEGGFHIIDGDIFGKFQVTDEFIPGDAAAILAPVDPPQIVAIGIVLGK